MISDEGPTTSQTTFYIASAQCYEVKLAGGSIATREDHTVWLGMYEGYPKCESSPHSAKKFKAIEDIGDWTQWDGMPWYYRLKPGSLKVYEIVEETIKSRTVREVLPMPARTGGAASTDD